MEIGSISDELRWLFRSFNVDIPNDPGEKSFVRSILNKDLLYDFVSEITYLSRGVELTKDNPKIRAVKPKTMRVYKIEVGRAVDELIERKDYLVRDFFESKEENTEKIMLVLSESVGMIDAKLRVYRKYKDDIDANDIFLLHAYENYDEIAKSIAFKKVSIFRNFVQDLINIFSTESLKSVVSNAIDISFTEEHITRLCFEVHINYKGGYVGSVNSGPYNCYLAYTVRDIKHILARETLMEAAKSVGSGICKDVLSHIKDVIQSKLSHELGTTIIISGEIYEEIQRRFRIVVGNFFRYIPDWIIRLVEDIINFLFGVFNPVNVNSIRWRSEVAREIYHKIMAQKTTITDHLLEQIETLCSNTKQDLEFIDRRLKEFMTSVFPKDRKTLHRYLDLPEPGCSIGIPSDNSSGSVGFLVEPNNPTGKFRCGFITASHVAVSRYIELYHNKSLLSMDHHLSLEDHLIVHPSWQDNDHKDNTIGQVIESFCGNYGLCQTGLDFALVKVIEFREEEKEALPIANANDLTFDGTTKVQKSGRTTGTTIGVLTDDSLTIRVGTSFLSRGYLAFYNCYVVENMLEMNDFFKEGDSGAGVFVIENGQTLKPLGIAFAFLSSQTAVCKIDTIIDKLDLTIVRYGDNKQKQAENSSSEINQEPMECA